MSWLKKLGHKALVALFCQTGGSSNELLHRLVARRHPPLDLGDGDAARIGDELRERGFYVFDWRVPADVCERLLDFSLRETAYERGRPRAVRYELGEASILHSDDAQALMADRRFLAVAQAYLQCRPLLDFVAMWWHTSFSQQPDKDAGQWFHFDMDRIKWLKFFIYLTDVGPENGPHTFVAGSHRRGRIPRSILRRGQVRIADAEVLGAYAKEDVVEFCGPRGTIVAEDTRGLHKGAAVRMGDRLVFQLQFSDSMFGADYGRPAGAVLTPSLRAAIDRYPDVYSRFS
jgi:hypothetical protein